MQDFNIVHITQIQRKFQISDVEAHACNISADEHLLLTETDSLLELSVLNIFFPVICMRFG